MRDDSLSRREQLELRNQLFQLVGQEVDGNDIGIAQVSFTFRT